MGTKRPSLTPFDTSDPSNQSASYQNPQPISQICRETSPRPGTVARTDRERERIREEEWRREREMERLKDKTRNRRKEMESGPRERNREKDCSPISRGREEEREWRERERGGAGERRANGRPTSNLEIRNHRDREKERRKGDTFPRMVKHSEERDRRMSAFVEEDVGKEGMRQLERPKGTEMDDWERERETAAKIQRYRDAERDFQSHREREREKERIRAQEDREKNGGKPMEDKTVRRRERAREAEPDFRERRRERDSKGDDLWSKRERYMDGERERSKLRQGEREDGRREGDSQNYSDREGRGGRKEGNTEGQRDTRSEGDSDGEKRNERVRDDNRRELKHLHSKSEGDTEGNAAWDRVREKEKERQKWRGGEIYRERDGRRDAYRQRVREGDRDGRRDAYRQRVREGDRDGRRDAYRQRVRERDRDGKSDMERYRERDRRKVREVERERDEVREGGRREDRPRERRDLEKVRVGTQPNVTGERGKRMDGERFRERERYSKGEDEERRCREKRDRETDPKREGGADGASRSLSETDPKREGEADGASRSLSETAPRVPPRVQSSGEWSSDIERERQWRRGRESHEEKESEGDVDRGQRECSERERPDRVRGREEGKEETIPKRPEQRKMWLLPQKVRYNKDSSLEDDVIERERDRHTNRWRERSEEEDRSVEQRTVRDKERKTEGEGQEDRSVEQRKSIGEEREAEREGGRERYLERGLNVDEDDETEDWRSYSRGEEHQTYSDGEREERWQRDRETERENVTDKTEGDREEEGGSDRYTLFESDGGSDREWEGGRDRIPSSEDGFITVSSGGEEEFEDCKEFLEVGVAIHVTRQPVSFQGSEGETKRGGGRRHERERERAEERTEQKDDALEGEVNDGKGKKQPTYVFCVIGQTLPRSKPNQTAVLGDMESERTNQNPGYGHRDSDDITHLLHENPSRDGDQGAEDERKIVRDEIHVPKEERTDTEESSIVDVSHTTLERESGERLKVMEENPYAEIERRRNSETEKLLKEWRERHEEYTETRERDPTDRRRTEPEIGPSSHPSGEYHHHGIPVVDQATSDQNNPVVMSPEEAVDIQICIRGAWSTEEEAKRHSQASHMKWAKNVLSEILGSSEEPALGNPQPESQGGQVVSQTTRGTERVEEELEEEKDETLEGGGASPVYATVQKRKKRGRKSVEERLAELEAEPGKLEDERGTGEKLTDVHAEAFTTMLGVGKPIDMHAALTLHNTHGDTPTDTQGEEVEGNNVCADRQTDSHIHIQVEMVTEDEGEMEKGVEVGDEVHILDAEKEVNAQKEEDLFLSVSNTLYKPTSCPSLIYNPDSEQPITTIEEKTEEEGEKERTVGEGEENSVVERKQERSIEDGTMDRGKVGEATEERKVEREEEKRVGGEEERMREGKEESKKTGEGGVKSTCSFQDLGTDVRYRRRGFRKTTERRNEEEEEGRGDARDRRTRIFQVSDEEEEEVSFNWGDMDLRNVTDTIRMARRNSKFYNSQLYQQYSETAQNREILSQSCSDALSIYEELPVPLSPVPSSLAPSLPPARRPLPCLPPVIHPHSLSHSGSTSSGTSAKFLSVPQPPQPPPARPSSPRLSISLTQSPSLWQEIPEVRNSAAFGELTNDQRRLQEVQFEVVTSEASYCRSLDIVVDHFVKSKQLGELLTTQDRSWLFSRLADVRAISHSFLSKLEERVESDMMHFTVCDIIARHCQRFKKVYVPYLTNQSYQDATYQRLMDENQGFRRVVEKLERSPVCQRLPLRSFLILPFQRITRIKLLVQNIVKRTAQGTEEEVQAIKAMKLLERLIQESNDSITQMKSIESLVSLSARVDFECRTLPLVSQSRRLVREGPVTEMMDFSLKETERSVYLHLFNDYLLLSLNKEGGRFTVIDHAPVSELRAENCRVKLHSLEKNLFRLHLNKKALLLSTDTQGDKLRWISAVSRPHPVIDYSAEQDFTQMQCVRAFVAHQPDELSLEKAEVIFVHQQSSDGWVEGTRLSDRHRGWTPESHLETIASLRVRQRNLQDALKITTATAAV
uniref:trichohyalin-like isoform X1 n=1 Tax=Oncorhynchus gorbuscha TaxID=8017 RepID=UPI001EAF3C56|nr:trichohyalin-like isoform X1 [Oncorhynchus gorbuscha]XP_046169419.1 trichohyalin-like isoform X1 [Oncorhynchus gorbuscha]